MGRLLGKPGEIIDHDWSPLDTAEAPEYIPVRWEGWHVGVRLVEAFRTLTLMPGVGRPEGHKTMWPAYRTDLNDYFAALVGETEELVAAIQSDRNRVRLRAGADDILRMELCLMWPAQYLGCDRLLCVVVNEVAYYRARGHDIERISRKMRCSPRLARHRNQLGLDIIAAGLRKDEIAIF